MANITDGATDILRFDGSHNVEIPNGNLNVSGGKAVVHQNDLEIMDNKLIFTGDTSGSQIDFQESGTIRADFQYSVGNNEILFRTYDGGGSAVGTLKMPGESSSAGNVNIPNGDLDMSGNNIDLDTGSSPGMDGADIDVNTLYYDSTTAKSPIVQCSQGSDWCSVTVPENQTRFYVETGPGFDKDRPRATADAVVDASAVELAERVRDQRAQIQALTAAVCDVNPDAEVCR